MFDFVCLDCGKKFDYDGLARPQCPGCYSWEVLSTEQARENERINAHDAYLQSLQEGE